MADGRPGSTFQAQSAATALTTSASAAIALGSAGDPVPDAAWLDRLWVTCTAHSPGKGDNIGWTLYQDSACDQPIASGSIDLDAGGSGKAGGSEALRLDWRRYGSDGTGGRLYLKAQIATGTTTATFRLLGEQR